MNIVVVLSCSISFLSLLTLLASQLFLLSMKPYTSQQMKYKWFNCLVIFLGWRTYTWIS